MCNGSSLGRIRWGVCRDARAKYGTIRKLDHCNSQLCMVAVGACWRGVVIAISRQAPGNACLLHCSGPASPGKPVAGRNSYRFELRHTICNRQWLAVSAATLTGPRARRVVPRVVWRDRIRIRGSGDTPHVHRNRRDDSPHRRWRSGDRTRSYSMGKFQSQSSYARPGQRYYNQTNLD